MSGSLGGLSALVTGGGTGIGQALAMALAGAGAAVAICGRREAPLLETRAAIEAAGGRCAHHVLDVADEAAAGRLAAACPDLDIVVNNAGVSPLQPWADVEPEAFRTVLATNLEAPFRIIQAVAPGMLARGFGRIVNITSIYGLVGGNPRCYPGLEWDIPAYVASKFALTGLTRHLAIRFAPHGVTVNAIAPGPIETALSAAKLTPPVREAITAAIPAGRLGAPADLAAAVLFLASRDAGFVTGQVVTVDGGWTAW